MACTLTYIAWDYNKEIDRTQLWAQAKVLFDEGEDWRLTGETYWQASDINRQYERINPIDLYLDECLEVQTPEDIARNGFSCLMATAIIDQLKIKGLKDTDRGLATGIAQYMKQREVESGRYDFPIKGTRVQRRGYRGVRLVTHDG